MKIVTISYENWEKYRRPLLRFSKRFDKTPSKCVYSWIFQLKKHHIEEPGTSIKLALWDGKIIAVSAVASYGSSLSEIVLSPHYQHTHVLSSLIQAVMQDLGVLYKKIRYNHEKSIKQALQSGLVCFSYAEGADGYVYLWFGGGHWHSDDISEKEA
ncbi:hypothetical protein [Bacillus sp. FJAT-45037]|uniref:hypothetical protein n=1 Tax=Bacillus sp. FJAT-45037 TaxID=2011007 RepID=UPI000C24CB7F|nr:hypothetical protein [Bacillus sp. FJAT-45037]